MRWSKPLVAADVLAIGVLFGLAFHVLRPEDDSGATERQLKESLNQAMASGVPGAQAAVATENLDAALHLAERSAGRLRQARWLCWCAVGLAAANAVAVVMLIDRGGAEDSPPATQLLPAAEEP